MLRVRERVRSMCNNILFLIVILKAIPHITLNPSSTNITVNETEALLVTCSATGTPASNVTWHGLHGDVVGQGDEKAMLNIKNMTRDDRGIYNCCATNNPNGAAACKGILVNVQYKPKIYVNSRFYSYNGSRIILRCKARGVPSPQISWYDPDNQSISTILDNDTGVSALKLVAINKDSYGLYRCRAENILGFDEHLVNVSRTDYPTETSKSITYVTSPTLKSSNVPFTKWISTRSSSSTNVAIRNPTEYQGKNSSPGRRNGNNKNIILVAVGGTVSIIFITTIIIFTVLILKKLSKNKADAQRQQRQNEVPSLPLEAADNTMPIYAKVDLSKKKRNKPQETLKDIPIYAQVDKSKKKRPNEIIYAELDHMHSAAYTSGSIPPKLSECQGYAETDATQNRTKSDKVESVYACILLE